MNSRGNGIRRLPELGASIERDDLVRELIDGPPRSDSSAGATRWRPSSPARAKLADELGIEPSDEAVRLHDAVVAIEDVPRQ